MFDAFKVASHIFTGTLEGIKELFDELKGGLMPLARSFRLLMESIEKEVSKDLKDKPKSKKKKVA
jgi:hypothetical protein